MMATTKTLKQLAKSVKLVCDGGPHLEYSKQDEWQQNANGYRCTLRYKGRQYSLDFWQGVGISGDPTAESVLECLLSDASVSDGFEEFCGEFGYDTDSRKAERLHKACLKIRDNMERLLGEDFQGFLHAGSTTLRTSPLRSGEGRENK